MIQYCHQNLLVKLRKRLPPQPAAWACLLMALLLALLRSVAMGATPASVPDKLVVLTFDDAVKSHRTLVAPLLKELGLL